MLHVLIIFMIYQTIYIFFLVNASLDPLNFVIASCVTDNIITFQVLSLMCKQNLK